MSEAELRRIGAQEFPAWLDTVLRIYTAAMEPPEDQLSGRQAIMRNHGTYPDFACWLAFLDDKPVGFAYGFHGGRGQWWHDVVSHAVQIKRGKHDAGRWLSDALEVAEIHVLPEAQSRGIGRGCLRRLCAERAERTAVLSTHDRPSAARHLYRSVGFTDLLTGFVFPGGTDAYAIMGATLPLTESSR